MVTNLNIIMKVQCSKTLQNFRNYCHLLVTLKFFRHWITHSQCFFFQPKLFRIASRENVLIRVLLFMFFFILKWLEPPHPHPRRFRLKKKHCEMIWSLIILIVFNFSFTKTYLLILSDWTLTDPLLCRKMRSNAPANVCHLNAK